MIFFLKGEFVLEQKKVRREDNKVISRRGNFNFRKSSGRKGGDDLLQVNFGISEIYEYNSLL